MCSSDETKEVEFSDEFMAKIGGMCDRFASAYIGKKEEIDECILTWTNKPVDEDMYSFLAYNTRCLCGGSQSVAQRFPERDGWLGSLRSAADLNEINDAIKNLSGHKFGRVAIILAGLSNPTSSQIKMVPFIAELDKVKKLVDIFNDNITNGDKCPAAEKDWYGQGTWLYQSCTEILNKKVSDFESKDEREKAFIISRILINYVYSTDYRISEEYPNHIFYGAPGTGKSFTVNNIIAINTNSSTQKELVQCHPGYGYEEFIEGLKPIGFTESGSIKFEVVNGAFKDLCIRALKKPKQDYYFVADEINRANLSAMFGEALSLLEPAYRMVHEEDTDNMRSTPLSMLIGKQLDELDDEAKMLKAQKREAEAKVLEAEIKKIKENQVYCKEVGGKYEVKFGIPKNVRFIGTMNDVDKSIEAFDIALRRRFVSA